MKIFRILIILPLFLSLSSYSQVWPKIYGGNTWNWLENIIEEYDKGFVITVQVEPGTSGAQMHSWFIKTDVNASLEWSKTVSSNLYQILFFEGVKFILLYQLREERNYI